MTTLFNKNYRNNLSAILIITGICVAVLSDLQEKIPQIAAFCGWFTGGCRQVLQYDLFNLSISFWGMGYYVSLALAYFVRRNLLFPLIMAGIGVEIVLVRTMFEQTFFCVFCVVNALVMLLLFITNFERKKLVSTLWISFLFYILFSELMTIPRSEIIRAGQENSNILATVNNEPITSDQVERLLTSRLHKIEKQVYKLKKETVDYLINISLLEQDAAQKGMTLESLKSSIRAKVPEPSKRIVEAYFKQKAYKRWINDKGTDAEIKHRIKTYVHQQQMNQRVLSYALLLKREADISIFIPEPPLPFTDIQLSGSPTIGPENATVTIIEFSDYLCPSCRKGHKTVNRVKEKYKGKIRWVFKDFPLNIHPGARKLAIAAVCADEQGKFWSYQDLLFSSKKIPEPSDVIGFANELNLDPDKFNKCLNNVDNDEQLDEQIRQATLAGISSTPTLIINGRLRIGIPSFEKLCEIIDQVLKESDQDGSFK